MGDGIIKKSIFILLICISIILFSNSGSSSMWNEVSDSFANFTGISCNIPQPGSWPYDIDTDNQFLYVVGSNNKSIYKYYMNCSYFGLINISNVVREQTPTSIAVDSNFLWVGATDTVNGNIYQFYKNGTNITYYPTGRAYAPVIGENETNFVLPYGSSTNLDIYDLTISVIGSVTTSSAHADSVKFNKDYIYILGSSNHVSTPQYIKKYDKNFTLLDTFLTLGPDFYGFTFNNSVLFAVNQTERKIYFYDLISPSYPAQKIYYNQFIFNNISDVSLSTGDSCLIILNNGPAFNISCLVANQSIVANNGQNNLTFFWTNASGTYSDEILFNVSVKCDSSTVGDKICASKDFKYIAACKNIGGKVYQFDYDNMTYCEDGCLNGSCLDNSFCVDNCIQNETMCDGNYVIYCSLKSNGCYDWTTINQTFCKNGCMDGTCMSCTDFCNPGDKKCMGRQIYNCRIGSNGCYDYSDFNATLCEFDCRQELNETTGYLNVTCNYHSFGDIYSLKDFDDSIFGSMDYVADTVLIKFWVVTILALFFGGFVGIKLEKKAEGSGWRVGLALMAIILFCASFYGWYPWIVTVLFFLFAGGVYYGTSKK